MELWAISRSFVGECKSEEGEFWMWVVVLESFEILGYGALLSFKKYSRTDAKGNGARRARDQPRSQLYRM